MSYIPKSLTSTPTNGTTLRIKKDDVEALNNILLELSKKMIEQGYEPIKFSELAEIMIKRGIKDFSVDDFMEDIKIEENK